MIDFLITGLPRTRTSWLALFLTTGKTICFHEPIRQIGLHWFDEVEQPGMRTGIADSAISLSPFQAFSKVPTVIILRDIEEVAKSFFAAFPGSRKDPARALKVLETIHFNLITMKRTFEKVVTVDYNTLSSVDTQRAIWEFCGVTEPFSTHRAALFEGVKCTQKP